MVIVQELWALGVHIYDYYYLIVVRVAFINSADNMN
jgi:hypothetical protein